MYATSGTPSYSKYSLSVLDRKNGLISTRYLMLMSHFILAISCMMTRDSNVKASLPLDYTAQEYSNKDTEMIVGVALTISFIFAEIITFGTGLTMFSNLAGAYSIMAHATGTLLHAYFILDIWDCWLYWWIFGFTACLPFCFDLASILVNFCLHDVKYKQ